ncbi:carbohydrate ABC transporter membrane protein 1, CUT1 family [Streptomyces zhaozhouensis]|uniref:Carbohydrate ABC transporter membrane protein 1, CUT1 family n=1 Tax=Streptomyces zhaozhouensis TaxID=1300267 RepID=A0A286DZN9_9ACTN|nr:sugar ABC transporter permease [Streptomyces zhaozhouensis]SOD64125.1 carbohydrate ABC transporter membrane protein 1, CUT1 family [Streptomyces zhaozhouensis]
MRRRLQNYGPPLLLIAPSVVLVGVFVYGLIAVNVNTSLTDRHSRAPADGYVGLDNYKALFSDEDFQHALGNLLMYTLAFLVGALFFGFLWAWLLERGARGEGVFRTIYLFPMAVSFIASGVVWRWLLNSAEGERASGINRLLESTGLGFLQNSWWSDENWGILALTLPAIWQLSGYVMALFLAGFRGVPEELREAARVDGVTEWQLYRHVIFPQLSPVALSAIIIVGHMSLKVFDLVMAIAGQTNYTTQVPATQMWIEFTRGDYALSAAIGTVLLLIVAVLIVPYLVYTYRQERNR